MAKGKRKPKLRDYSHLSLTSAEYDALLDTVASPDRQPIATAVLGAVLVEHELEGLLRRKLKRSDDKTWEAMLEERGPLRSFYAKICYGVCTRNLR